MEWQKNWRLPLYIGLILGCTNTQILFAATSATGINGFIDDATFDMKLRNAFFNNASSMSIEGQQNPPDVDWGEWAQGFEVLLSSGYLADIVGIDFASYHGVKMHAYHSINGLTGSDDQLLAGGPHKSEGYSRVGKLLLKAKIGDEYLNAQLKSGWLGINTEFMTTSNTRLTPSSFQGGELNMGIFDTIIYGAFANRMAKRTGETYDDFINKSNKKIDYVYAIGAEVDVIGFRVIGEYAESKDYIKHLYGGMSYNIDLNVDMGLLLDAKYYKAKKAGVLWDGAFTKDASVYNLNIVFTYKALDISLSHSGVKAKGGQYEYYLAQNNYDDYGAGGYWTSRQVSDFNQDDEKALQIATAFNFSEVGVPGLLLNLTYTYGSDFKEAAAGKRVPSEQEFDTSVSYEFLDGELKGIKLAIDSAAYYRRNIGGSRGKKSFCNDLRLYADYTAIVF